MPHPSSLLVAGLVAVVACQFLGPAALAVGTLVLLAAGRDALGAWRGMLLRMRWLLASVWLILAYGVPGDAPFGLDWLPTHEGLAEASQHVARLALMLGCLAWLLRRLGREGLMTALLGLLQPWTGGQGGVERFVVRLALVMDHLQQRHRHGDWRAMLAGPPDGAVETAVLTVALPGWRAADVLLPAAVVVLSLAAAGLG